MSSSCRFLACLWILSACAPSSSPEARPNLLVIVADDVGIGSIGAYGAPIVRTPNIDSLAADGVRFTQGYVSAPACAPSRAALLTGRDHNRYGYDRAGTVLTELREGTGVPESEVLLSDVLRGAGYATGAFGKWHLGSAKALRPRARGFDVFFGFLSGAHDYFDWGSGLWGPVFRNDERAIGDTYLTEAIAAEAVQFIEAHAGGPAPFFAYVAFNAIHAPFQVPESYKDPYRSQISHDGELVAAGLISALDAGVGEILSALQRLGLTDDTLVFFLSDNGGDFWNGDLRGVKGSLLEGGIRVPFLVRWPGVVPAGRDYDPTVTALDVFPTLRSAARAPAPEARAYDGLDLLPFLTGAREGPPHEALYWQWEEQWAVRVGPAKYTHARTTRKPVPVDTFLFDLGTDPTESTDLGPERPDLVGRLCSLAEAWREALENDAAPPELPHTGRCS